MERSSSRCFSNSEFVLEGSLGVPPEALLGVPSQVILRVLLKIPLSSVRRLVRSSSRYSAMIVAVSSTKCSSEKFPRGFFGSFSKKLGLPSNVQGFPREVSLGDPSEIPLCSVTISSGSIPSSGISPQVFFKISTESVSKNSTESFIQSYAESFHGIYSRKFSRSYPNSPDSCSGKRAKLS